MLAQTLSTQGNVSNIPGLSQPGANLPPAVSSKPSISAIPYGAPVTAYPATSVSQTTSSSYTAAASQPKYFSYGQVPVPNSREHHSANSNMPAGTATSAYNAGPRPAVGLTSGSSNPYGSVGPSSNVNPYGNVRPNAGAVAQPQP